MPRLMVVSFPMMFLSGLFFSADIMPESVRPVLNGMPLTYLGDSLHQMVLCPWHPHYLNMAALGDGPWHV